MRRVFGIRKTLTFPSRCSSPAFIYHSPPPSPPVGLFGCKPDLAAPPRRYYTRSVQTDQRRQKAGSRTEPSGGRKEVFRRQILLWCQTWRLQPQRRPPNLWNPLRSRSNPHFKLLSVSTGNSSGRPSQCRLGSSWRKADFWDFTWKNSF